MRIMHLQFLSSVIVVILSGCVHTPLPQTVDTIVTTFYSPEYKNVGSISVVASSVEVNNSLEFAHYKARIEKQLATHGYTIKNNPSEAEYIALVAYGIDEGKTGTVSIPILGQTGGGATFTSYGTSSYTMPSYGVVASSTNSFTAYTRAIALDIVKTETFRAGKPIKLLELRAKSVGTCSVISGVFEEILESMFQDFPVQNGKTRKITVDFKGNC